jgi:sensor domain CHASE-containing protein
MYNEDTTAEMTTAEWAGRKVRNYPDSAQKQRVCKLAEKLDEHRSGDSHQFEPGLDFADALMKHQQRFFELWWELTAAINKLEEEATAKKADQNRRWEMLFIISILAFGIAVVLLVVAIYL